MILNTMLFNILLFSRLSDIALNTTEIIYITFLLIIIDSHKFGLDDTNTFNVVMITRQINQYKTTVKNRKWLYFK
jgi:hypothetical protein